MKWSEVLEHPALQDIPFKVELSEWGQVIMSPANVTHGYFQHRIGVSLEMAMTGGIVISECPVLTAKNVKVPDLVWMSDRLYKKYGFRTPLKKAPELCVEILSPSNSDGDIEEKRELYFASGAQEVWICDRDGKMTFYARDGVRKGSRLFPKFPSRIKLPAR